MSVKIEAIAVPRAVKRRAIRIIKISIWGTRANVSILNPKRSERRRTIIP
jgi:hypothetical protein